MAPNPQDSHRRSSRAFWPVLMISTLMLVMIAGAALTVTPGLARAAVRVSNGHQPSYWSVVNIAKPTSQPPSWSLVNVAKPTYTPSPTLVPTATVTPTATVSLANATPVQSVSNLQDGNQGSSGGKYILVSISEQHLSAYENGQLIYSFIASTGMRGSTRVG